MSGYDTAITTFSPNGHLFQVEYAMEAVKRGLCCVAIKANDCIVFGVEKKTLSKLQEDRTLRKILQLDNHITIAFTGLNADARILANQARLECQSYKLNYSDIPPIEYIAKYIANLKQKFTQKGGVRPYGLSLMIAGFDSNGQPRLFQTDPSGALSEWKANCLGRNTKQVKEYLEKNYKEFSEDEAVHVACKALFDVVESGAKNIEIVVIKQNGQQTVDNAKIEAICKEFENI